MYAERQVFSSIHPQWRKDSTIHAFHSNRPVHLPGSNSGGGTTIEFQPINVITFWHKIIWMGDALLYFARWIEQCREWKNINNDKHINTWWNSWWIRWLWCFLNGKWIFLPIFTCSIHTIFTLIVIQFVCVRVELKNEVIISILTNNMNTTAEREREMPCMMPFFPEWGDKCNHKINNKCARYLLVFFLYSHIILHTCVGI